MMDNETMSRKLSQVDVGLMEDLIDFLEPHGLDAVADNLAGPVAADQVVGEVEDIIFAAQDEALDIVDRRVDIPVDQKAADRDFNRLKAAAAAIVLTGLFAANIETAKRRESNSLRVDKVVKTETVRTGIDAAGDGGVGVGGDTIARLGRAGLTPVAYRWVLGKPEFPHPEHEILGGGVVESLSEWDTRPGDHQGCRCRIELLYEEDLT